MLFSLSVHFTVVNVLSTTWNDPFSVVWPIENFSIFSRYLRTGISFSGEILPVVDVISREKPKAGSPGKNCWEKQHHVWSISVCNLTERKPEATHVITSVISRRYSAEGGTELLSNACRTCRTCSTLTFSHSTNHVIDLWRCRCRSRRRSCLMPDI